MNFPTALETLIARVSELPSKDQSFANSLIQQAGQKRGLSDKQAYWVQTFAKRIVSGNVTGERVKTAVGDLTGIMALFGKAQKKLKAPAIVLALGEQEVRISVAGAKAKVPGSLNVATPGGYGEGTWFGRILQSGEFEASPRVDTPAPLLPLLSAFAAEPAKVAAEHGKLTGRCCFCNLPLKDARSTAVGYGPTCADNFGLPYGIKAAQLAHAA